MKRLNNAFTLTELLVALGVVGILCAILMPVIFNLIPNQNTIMAKRAYYTVQTIVSELINDEACYPDKTSSITDKKVGFDDGAGTANCLKWGEAYINGGDQNTKFRTLFLDKLGKDAVGAGTVFNTDDGMDWVFTSTNFTTTGTDGGFTYLTVDVNGSDEPNCSNGHSYSGEFKSGTDGNCTSRKTGFDRFRMKIYGTGKVQIDSGDKWAIEAVKVNKSLTDD